MIDLKVLLQHMQHRWPSPEGPVWVSSWRFRPSLPWYDSSWLAGRVSSMPTTKKRPGTLSFLLHLVYKGTRLHEIVWKDT